MSSLLQRGVNGQCRMVKKNLGRAQVVSSLMQRAPMVKSYLSPSLRRLLPTLVHAASSKSQSTLDADEGQHKADPSLVEAWLGNSAIWSPLINACFSISKLPSKASLLPDSYVRQASLILHHSCSASLTGW